MWHHPLDLLPKTNNTHMPKVHKVSTQVLGLLLIVCKEKKERKKGRKSFKCQNKLECNQYESLHASNVEKTI
jgi:hypothetical protein